MKVLIVSPSTHHLNCGIAAFSSVLSKYFEQLGMNTIRVGLQDAHTTIAIEKPNQISFPVGHPDVVTFIKSLQDRFQPSFIWINYSPLGFSKSYYDSYYLRQLANNISHTPTVIFFHEYWPGNFFFEHRKFKIVKGIMLLRFWQMLPFFKKATVLTNSEYGMRQLKRYGMQPAFTPVFSNIYSNPPVFSESSIIELILFGSSGFPFDETALVELLNRPQQKVLHVVGKNNQTRIQSLQDQLNSTFLNIKYYHHLQEDKVAQLLKRCDYGITNYYESLSTKSGAVSAYKAYGLPIIGIGMFANRPEIKSHDQIFLRVNDLPILQKKETSSLDPANFNQAVFTSIQSSLQQAGLI